MMLGRRIAGMAVLSLLAAGLLGAQESPGDPGERCWGKNPQAPVQIEVFSDFSCPACRQLYLETTRSVLSDYATAGKVCVSYYEFPLRGNEHSRTAAKYARAAAWLGPTEWVQVTDTLFVNQGRWTKDGAIEPFVAKALSAEEMKKVRQWMDDPQLEAAIDRDLAEGRQRNVQRTPTIFITANGNSERVVGAIQYGILRRYLDSLLARR